MAELIQCGSSPHFLSLGSLKMRNSFRRSGSGWPSGCRGGDSAFQLCSVQPVRGSWVCCSLLWLLGPKERSVQWRNTRSGSRNASLSSAGETQVQISGSRHPAEDKEEEPRADSLPSLRGTPGGLLFLVFPSLHSFGTASFPGV